VLAKEKALEDAAAGRVQELAAEAAFEAALVPSAVSCGIMLTITQLPGYQNPKLQLMSG
jgi:hypothetical protein